MAVARSFMRILPQESIFLELLTSEFRIQLEPMCDVRPYFNSQRKIERLTLRLPLQSLMLRFLFSLCLLFVTCAGHLIAQCTVYDGQGNASTNPVWVSCSGGSYTLYIQSPNTYGALTINWGDGTANTTVASLVPPAFVSHTYAATIDNYTVTITESGAGGCTITGLVVMEEPVNASIQIPIGGVTQTCAPDELIFTNNSTDVSSNTVFTWDFGDGSPIETYGDTNQGQTVSHVYEQNTVDCVTEVTLTAENYCSFGNPTEASFNPIQIYDIDEAEITVDFALLCYPDTVVHFDNTTDKNCVPQGNTAQRFEYWNFGNYWGTGQDSIIDWVPFDPPAKPGHDIAFPGVGTYTVMMADSNMCGADTVFQVIQIVDAPIAGFTVNVDSACEGESITFNRTSNGGNSHRINFGDGGGFQNFPNTTNHAYNSAGTYIVQVVVNVGGGSPSCTDTIADTIEVLPSPNAVASISPSGACDSVTVIFLNASSGASTYLWNFGGGNTSTLQNPPAATYNTPGQYVVSLTVTSNNGCIDSTTATLDVYDTPEVIFEADNVCEDALASFNDSSTVGYGGPINAWTWNFGDTLNTTSNAQHPTFTYNDSGTYVVSLVASTSYCSDTAYDTLLVEPRPVALFTPSDTLGCSPLSVSFNNQSIYGATHYWSFGDGSTSTAANPTYTFNHSALTDTFFVVQLVATSAFGCEDSITDTIHVLGNPIAHFGSDATLDCAPLQVQFSDSSIGAVSWQWDFDDGFGSTTQNPAHTFENQTQFISNYTITLTATAANGCTDSAFETITVYPEPLFGFNIVPDSGCSPLTVQFPVAIGAVLYNWDFGDNTTSTGPNPSHTYVNNTTNNAIFEVTLIATSPFGCVDTVTGEVVVHPKPNADVTPNLSFGCQPLDVTFANNSTGGSTYEWDFGDGTNYFSNSATVAHQFSNLSNDTLVLFPTLYAETADGCRDTAMAEVQVYRLVSANFVVDTVACHPFNAVFADSSVNPQSWLWDFDDGYTSGIQHPTHLFVNQDTVPITRSVSLEVVSIEGCVDDAIIDLRVLPKPRSDFDLEAPTVCNLARLGFENQSDQAAVSAWNLGSGTFQTGLPIVFDTLFENAGTAPLDLNIELAVENAYGCVDTSAKELTVFPLVSAAIEQPGAACSPFEVQFENNSLGANLFQWNFGDGNMSFIEEPTHEFAVNGTVDSTYTVSLVATSPFGCADSDTVAVMVYARPEPQFFATPMVQRFPDSTVLINNLTVDGGWLYEWNWGDGESTISQNPVRYHYSTWGEYRILLRAYSQHCEDTTSLKIVIEPPYPIAQFENRVEECAPVTVAFENTSQYGEKYLWEFGDGATSTSESPIHTYQFAGTYDVKLSAWGPGGDVDIEEVVAAVVVRPQPVANFVVTPMEVAVPNPVNFINYSQFAEFYEWRFGDGSVSDDENPQKTYNAGGEYFPMLIASTAFGCADTFTLELPIIAIESGTIEVPNAFKPLDQSSGDGFYDPMATDNRVFFPVLKGVVSDEYTLSIYNRWGELLFLTHDIGQGWNGFYRGKPCVQDVYVWKVEGKYATGEKFREVGDVTLIK